MTSPEVGLSPTATRLSVRSPSPPECATERRRSDSVEPEMELQEPELELPYPEYEPRALWLLDQTMRPRTWCLVLINWPYPLSDDRHL